MRTTPEKRLGATEEWTGEMQLLALLIEVTSIGTAGKQIKKPIDIPRPGKKGKGQSRSPREEHDQRNQQGQQDQEGSQPLRTPPQPPSRQGPAMTRDAAFKQGIAVLQRTSKVRR